MLPCILQGASILFSPGFARCCNNIYIHGSPLRTSQKKCIPSPAHRTSHSLIFRKKFPWYSYHNSFLSVTLTVWPHVSLACYGNMRVDIASPDHCEISDRIHTGIYQKLQTASVVPDPDSDVMINHMRWLRLYACQVSVTSSIFPRRSWTVLHRLSTSQAELLCWSPCWLLRGDSPQRPLRRKKFNCRKSI